MSDKYILNESQIPVPCDDLMKWGKWFEVSDRHVAQDKVGNIRISTVFLGLDHSFGHGPPLLYETMIFGGPDDGYQTRASTRGEAIEQHSEAVAMVRNSLLPKE